MTVNMLRTILFPLFAASSAIAQNPAFLTGFTQALNNSGLHQLINTAERIANTTIGQQLIASLQNGNHTFLAPNDNSFNGSPPKNITDVDSLAGILSYHLISGSFNATSFTPAPGYSILRTFMNSSEYVTLEGSKSQVLALTSDNGTISIIGQNTQVKIVSSTNYQNLLIHVIDAVLDPPPKLSDVFFSTNLSMFQSATTDTGILPALETTHGITVFAPTDAAINATLQALGGPTSMNASTLITVLDNHLVNGTSVYSTEFSTGNWTSAAGEPFIFTTNSSGIYVTSGPSTAKIVKSDIFTSNGVVHVIDGVLWNIQNNSAAAASAYASATSAAASTATQTVPVGAQPSASQSASSGKNGNGATSLALPTMPLFISVAFVMAGFVWIL